MIRLPPKFLAAFQIVIYRLFEGGAQLGNALAVEADDVSNARDMADEAAIFLAVLHLRRYGQNRRGDLLLDAQLKADTD